MEQNGKYLVVIERADDGTYSGYVPDLPVCMAFGQKTPQQACDLIGRAVGVHVQAMVADGLSIPSPSAQAHYVDVPVE